MNSEKKKLLKETYEKFMKVSMNELPAELLDGITADNIMAYGTAIDEKLQSIQDCRDLVERQLEQASGMKFKHERIPVSIIISPEEDSAIFVEELNLTIKSKEVTHRLFLRITTALEYSDNKWKVVHFHTSKPDDTNGETDTWHIDEWKRKNEELQKLVDEKTSDLVIKNRDLEIEASLERVRTIAMSMRKSDDLLNICETLFNELKILGFDELRNTMINIHNDEEKTFINYDYSDTLGKTITPLLYNINPIISKQIKQIRKGKDAFSETSFKGDDLKEWKKFRKRKGEPDDPRLKDTKALYYYFYSIGTGSIGISTFGSITKRKLDLLKRFRNVFEFAYRRYMDVMQAEEQAKEAKLEASLERVRAQAMSINKSEQLGGISEIIFTELKALGFTDLRNAEIIINSDKKESVISYYYSDYGVTETIEIFYNKHPKVKKWAEEMRKADDAFTSVEFGEDEIVAWRKYREEIGYLPDPKLNKAKAVYYYSYSIGPGALSISSFKKIGDEQLKILERFRNVFGLAYRRYADIALAEEQAKEAKLEASLERVRTHSMVMKKPDDLVKVCESLFNELRTMGFMNLRNSQIVVFNDDNKSFLNYDYSDYAGANTTTILNNSHPLIQSFINKIKKSKESFAEFSVAGKELKEWKKFRKKNGELPDPKLEKSSFVYYYFYSIGNGAIGISTFATITIEELEILKRFRNVFEFAYGKYSDVTKAEEQAREVMIELSLERVRARSMAMHSSDELVDASIVLFNELKSLGIESIRTGVGIFDESIKAVEIWSSQLIKEKRNKILGVVPFKSHPFFELNYKAWKRKEPYFFYEIAGKEVKKYYKIMSSVLSYPEKKEFNPKEIFYTFFFPEGSLNVVSKNNLTDNECSLMIRFAKVFGMIYRRFLDLQNAEAQARESQIQLALERVRAKAMAMQKSDELLGVSLELYNQFKQLDSSVRGLTINIINEKERVFEVSFGMFNQSFKLSIDEKIVVNKAYKCWKSGKKSLVLELDRDEVIKFNKIRNKAVGSEIFPLKYKPGFKLIMYIAFFSNGMLIVGMSENRPDETLDILQRFASVFDLSYTRFLDLKKAESQSREAQIELALERVRARTMAMQRSDELEETSQLLFQQFKELGEHPERITIGTIIEDERQIELWVTVEGDRNRMVKVSIDETDVFKKTYLAWKEQKKSILIDLTGMRLSEYLKYRSSFGNTHGNSDLPKDRIISYVAFFSKGLISITTPTLWSGENIQLLERFAGVFDLTYTRFLDLQKAEAQAKESQIELGLERVRARAMAMQKSGELSELVDTVFKELTKLDFALTWCIINIIDEKTMSNSVWAANPDIKKATDNYYMKFEDYPFHHAMFKGWKERDTKFIYVIEGREKQIYDDYLFSETEFRKVPKAAQQASRAMKKYVSTFSFSNFGGLQTVGDEPLSEVNLDILERFGKVFDLTYTRFNDLLKAESQSREAQIEVALERVRSRTMAMHKSEELAETAAVLFQQLCVLGIDALRLYIGIIEEECDEIEFWTTDYGGSQISSKYKANLYGSTTFKNIYTGWKEKQKSIVVDPKGKELTEHLYYLKEIMGYPIRDRKTLSRRLQTIAYFSNGFIGVLSNDELPKESVNLLERFTGVFDLTYRRFLDLKISEAQTREAQIEVALERVRSRTMAMHSSDELQEAAVLLFQQIRELGVDTGSCGYVIWENKNKEATVRMSSAEGGIQDPFNLPHTKSKIYKEIFSAKESGKDFFVKEVRGAELKKHFDFLTTVPGIGEKIKQLRKARYKFPETIVYNCAFFKQGYLSFHTHEQNPDAHDIFRRFANVFEQTYTRFLDLKKAEAQAKEAQIEASLEKVRSRSLAMHSADELGEVITVVVEKLRDLDFSVDDGVALITHIECSKDLLEWMVNPGFPSAIKFYLPYFEHPVLSNLWKAKNDGAEFVAARYTAKENKSFLNHIFKHSDFKHTPQPIKDYCLAANTYATSIAFQKHTAIFINDYSGKTLTEQEIDILKRFSKVFEQAYIRFLDLQKAEGQVKEAQIEAALERVRSRTMGMQKSEELKDVIQVIYEQFVHLNINIDHAGIIMDYKERDDMNIWVSDHRGNLSQVIIPYFDSEHWNRFNEAKEKGLDFFPVNLNFKEKNRFYKKLFKYIPGIPEEAKDFYFGCQGLAISTVLLDNVSLYIENFSGTAYTEEENATLMRFGKVFQQTYTRFLDLQKAEVQAREAQIELGLERVRARAMAMQNSKELEELIGTVFTELTKLDLALTRCIIWVFEPATNAARWWMANSEEPSNPMSFFIKYHEHPAYLSFVKEWKRQNVKFVYDLNGEDKIAWDDILFNETELKLLPDAVKDGMRAPERVLLSGSFNNFGGINAASLEPLSDEHFDILLRFAKVFDLTYTRFNDLQKAEAQAREAKIETSLERVRSKTMAMHNSPEVGETVAVMFDELRKLGIETYRCGIGILYETKEMEVWAAKPDDKGKAELIIGYLDMSMHPLLKGALDNWKNKKDSYYYHLKGKDLINYFNAINKHANYPAKYNFDSLPREIFHHDFYFKEGTLFVFTLNQITAEDESTFKRFAGVFGQTYRRYKDLQKAEAQAKEAQIEAALERTRTQSMLMQHSSELDITSRVFHEQLLLLGIGSEISFVWLPDVEKGKHLFWTTWVDTEKDSNELKSKSVTYDLDRTEPYTAECFRAWESGEPVHVYKVAPGEVKIYFDTWGELFADAKRFPEYFPKGLYYAEAFMKYGCFGFIISRQLTEDEKKILLRFTIEFERTYSRFLDLQKAEAQAREALIEAALERVRGKAMAMHNSVDLTEAAGTVFSELNNLGIHPIRTGFVLLSKDSRIAKLYPATSFDNKNTVSFTGEFEFTGHPVYEKQYEIWQNNENYFPVLEGELLKSYYKILVKGLSVPYENFPTAKKQFGTFLPFSEGFLFTWSDEQYSDNEINILDRFKNILDLTIRRYIDLKNAEAQSRESQIEASLERVRSKAMAMQKSEDLALAVSTIFEELDKLDLGALRCGIGIIDKAKKSVDVWATAISDGRKTVQVSGDESMDTHPLLKGAFDAWLRQEDFSYLLQGADLKKYYEVQIESNFKLPESQSIQNDTEGLKQYYYVAVFQSGGLFAFRETPFPEEAITVIKRFADVINFTYTRFNDLKQAEAQAKEAKIEAALERVRAGSLIMRKPEDMFDVCKVISEQLKLLKVNEIRNTQTVILNEGKETYKNYEYFPDYNEKTFSEIDYNLHPKVTEFVNEIKKSSEAFFTTSFEGNELQEWREYRKNTNQIPDAKLDSAHSVHYYFYSIGPGALGISTYAPLSEEEISIFKRFRNVFELAYRRYIDIEQAEAQAREAQIEAALERVRSRTLAMQKSDELAETAAVVFKQLINLGIEPNRLYIGIINDDSGNIEAWATDEDGSKVSKEFTLNINANASVKKMYDGWAEKKKSIIIDMHGEVLESYLHYIGDVLHVPFKGGLSQDRRVQNIAYFSKGFIGMASPDPQPEETAVLLERFAAVFNLTFTRFNDLQIAEKHAEQAELDLIKLQTEKKRAEEALTELRSTQAQLIQSEKMASLGELTAGIAHEIQNPLNFVNNFSEVNSELVEELNHELAKGNFDEAIAIAKDIKENEDKIKHHGKRAEGIVKGMLQHSRSSSGVKEPVNINALADEYLRLAYHGLRAKDKTFNAKMETDFDESIGKINVIPQDIGRVILNLITNAFYSVDEKKKLLMINGYEPTVTVITKRENNNALITVKDNGNGIPQKVMDKIFQPFFTTKPTGQGTGLGLSMSYDIIKAHGGELNVETKEGEGAEFVIVLPLPEN